MILGQSIRGYFRSRNEEQIRLTCHRMGYRITELAPWRHDGKSTGWVWITAEPIQLAGDYVI